MCYCTMTNNLRLKSLWRSYYFKYFFPLLHKIFTKLDYLDVVVKLLLKVQLTLIVFMLDAADCARSVK